MPLPEDLTERLHTLETAVQLLSKDSEIQTRVLEKLDSSTDRLTAIIDAVSRQSAIHEEKFRFQDRINSTVDITIADRRSEAARENADLRREIDAHERRLLEAINSLKDDLLARIDNSKSIMTTSTTATTSTSDGKSTFLQTILSNYKYLLFGAAFAAGILTHKWQMLTTLFGLSN